MELINSGIDDFQNVIEISLMGFLAVLGAVFAIAGIVVVNENAYLRVGHIAFLWAVPCAIWNLHETLPFLDRLMSNFVYFSLAPGYNARLFLGINRFLALAFNGRYFEIFNRLKVIQYFILFTYPTITFASLFRPGCAALFVGNGFNHFEIESQCSFSITPYTITIASYFYHSVTTFFDIAVFFLVRRRHRALHRDQKQPVINQRQSKDLQREYRLALQMAVQAFAVIASTSAKFAKALFTTPFTFYLGYTTFWQLHYVLLCMSYAFLLRDPKPKSDRSVTSSNK